MSKSFWVPFHRLSPLDFVVALYNVSICEHADCDPEYTKKKLIATLTRNNGSFTKAALERVLFCLNMNHEDGIFWHPLDRGFDKYLVSATPRGYTFDKYYNLIKKKKVKK